MKKILITEDDKFLSKILKNKLEKVGFQVVIASDGKEALDSMRAEKFDLVVLDLIMPVKDGFQVMAEMKEDSKLSKIPVIIASNLGQKEDMERTLNYGAKDYIVKSDTSINDIIGKINAALS